jgi:hypothetical protein
MVKYESGCVDCGFPCIGMACRHYRVKVLKCDNCRQEVDKLYKYDGKELCEECVLEELEVVE